MNDIVLDDLQFINNELKTINWFELFVFNTPE